MRVRFGLHPAEASRHDTAAARERKSAHADSPDHFPSKLPYPSDPHIQPRRTRLRPPRAVHPRERRRVHRAGRNHTPHRPLHARRNDQPPDLPRSPRKRRQVRTVTSSAGASHSNSPFTSCGIRTAFERPSPLPSPVAAPPRTPAVSRMIAARRAASSVLRMSIPHPFRTVCRPRGVPESRPAIAPDPRQSHRPFRMSFPRNTTALLSHDTTGLHCS